MTMTDAQFAELRKFLEANRNTSTDELEAMIVGARVQKLLNEADVDVDWLNFHMKELGGATVQNMETVLAKIDGSGSSGPNVTDGALKLASDYEIDLEDVEGTGANGRITKEDVQRVIDEKTEPATA